MRMSYADSQRVKNELELISKELRERIDDYKKKEEQSINQTLFLALKPLFHSYRILGKDQLSNADIEESDTELQLERLYEKVQTTIDDSLFDNNKAKSTTVTSIFGVYDSIVRKIGSEKKWKMHLLDFSCYAISFLNFYFIFAFIESITTKPDDYLPHMILGCSSSVAWFISRLIYTAIDTREFKLRIKTKNILMIMVYYKLIISDLSFLESSDNNLIYRLFYWDLDEYSSYLLYFSNYFLLLILGVIFLLFALVVAPGTGMDIFFVIVLIITLYTIICTVVRAIYFWKYRAILTKEREVIYELLYSLKGTIYSNLKNKYKQRLKVLKAEKGKVLRRIYFYSSCVTCLNSIFPLTTSMSFIVYFFIVYYDDLKKGKIIDSSVPGFGRYKLSYVITGTLMHLFLLQQSKRFLSQIEAWIRRRASKSFYDKFFENDYIVQRAQIRDSTLGLGYIFIEGCNVYERDHKSPSQNLDVVFKNNDNTINSKRKYSGHKDADDSIHQKDHLSAKGGDDGPGTLMLNTGRGANNEATSSISNTLHQPSTEFEKDSTIDTIRQVAKSLTVRIKAGDRLCVIWNKHTPAIHGFIKLLIGENIIGGGVMRYNGRISYFSKENMPFLVGKTIRDNILFGEDYDAERYQEVLATVGINFDKYNGRDYYQVGEKACNIKSDDKLSILLSRFLYRDSNIYVVEDLFIDPDQNFIEHIVSKVFNGFIKGKTLIYVANDPQFVNMATMKLRFKSNYEYKLTEVDKNDGPNNPHKNSDETFNGGRFFTAKGKIKNSIFLENASYEEELAIHKKLQQQKKEIASKMDDKTNIVEKLSYGIYLTNKRRQEGQNIEENDRLHPSEVRDFGLRLIKKKSPFRKFYIIVWLFLQIEVSLVILVEYYMFVRCWDENSGSVVLTYNNLLTAIILYFAAILVAIVKSIVTNRMYFKIADGVHSDILKRLFLGQFNWVNRMKIHEILSKTNEHMSTLEVNQYSDALDLCEHVAWCIGCVLTLLRVFSIVLPLIVFSLYFGILISISIRILPAMYRAIAFTYFNQYKKDDFNFQLLSLIFGHRVTGMIQKLNTRFLRLSDNLSRSDKLVYVEYKVLFSKINNILKFFLFLVLISLLMLFTHVDSLNWFKMSKLSLLYSAYQSYRLVHKLEMLVTCLLDHLTNSLNLYRLFSFLESGAEYQERKVLKENVHHRTVEPDFTRGVVFKQVSLTLGYKPILKKISFKVRPRQRVGIMGVEGGGRSSIFDLILGIKTKDSARASSDIYVFGLPVEDIKTDELRAGIYYMDKSPNLFEGTIRENIDPSGSFSDDVIISVIKELGIEKVLKKEILKNEIELKRTNRSLALPDQQQYIKQAIDEVRINLPGTTTRSAKESNLKTNVIVPLPKVSITKVQSESLLNSATNSKKPLAKQMAKRMIEVEPNSDNKVRSV